MFVIYCIIFKKNVGKYIRSALNDLPAYVKQETQKSSTQEDKASR